MARQLRLVFRLPCTCVDMRLYLELFSFQILSTKKLRKVDASGIITHYAGNGADTAAGDSGRATSAYVNPYACGVNSYSSVYVVTTLENRIRSVTFTDKTISTIFGTGTSADSGDGGAATSANVKKTENIFVDTASMIIILDSSGNKLRRVSADGTMVNTYGFTGSSSFIAKGPITSASMPMTGSKFTGDTNGNLFITSNGYGRVIRIDGSGDKTVQIVAGMILYKVNA